MLVSRTPVLGIAHAYIIAQNGQISHIDHTFGCRTASLTRRQSATSAGVRGGCHTGAMPNESATTASGPATTDAPVTVTVEGAVALVMIDAAQTRNALSMPVMGALVDALTEIGERTDVHAVVLSTAGHVFCSGHDLKEIRGADHARQQEIFERCSQLMLLIQSIPQPVIAAVQGVATAAGCQLVATCDLAVAAESARFGTPGVRIGLFCSTPMVALSRAVPRKTAMRMLMTGDLLDAEQALAFGLVSHVVADDELAAAASQVAQTVAEASAATVAIGKQAFYQQIHLDTPGAYAQMSETMAANAVMPDAQEGIDAFLTKRQPQWQHRTDGT